MVTSPPDFNLIVQGPLADGSHLCRGVADAPVALPVRVEVISDRWAAHLAADLTAALWQRLDTSRGGWTDCNRWSQPLGANCWAWDSPVAHNVLVVVAHPVLPPSPWLEEAVRAWQARDRPVYGVVARTTHAPDVLPASLATTLALSYDVSVDEVVSGVLDAIFLTGEERRAFISYAHVDGFPVATELYRMLSLQQFDVYLDRYRTNPAVDFVERIEDELRDKTMLVVVETRGAAASSWVGTEVLAARSRGYGLLGVFLTDVAASARHPWIPQSCRIELDSTAPDAAEVLLQSVVDTYRRCVVSQRVQRRDGIRLALRTAVRDAAMAGRLAQPYPSIVEHGDEMEFVVSGARYRVLGSFRPGGVRKAREVAGRSTDDTVPVVFSPTPGRRERTHDVMWLDDETPVTFVADGWMTVAARQMLRADL